jgi:GT2 family glycosyltransferase
MPTAVLDLDLDALPEQLAGLERYDRALILLRLRGRPIGQTLLPIAGGRLAEASLRDAILCRADSAFWEQWLAEQLWLGTQHPTLAPQPPATVVICTRDRPADLRMALDALVRLPDDGQEILIVDNAPTTEATRELVACYPRVRYVRENRPGLDLARNRALREARYDLIAFTDDDAAPDPNWLRALLRNFDRPHVACVTGLTMPSELETEAQEWFQRLGGLGRGFKRTVFDSVRWNPLESWVVGAGVNMAIRRDVVSIVGPFDERLDVGTPTRGGGDTEFFSRVLAAGYQIVYDPEALNWHRHRREWQALQNQLSGYEMAGFAVWTRSLLCDGELEALKQMWDWVGREVPNLWRAARRQHGSPPLDLVWARFRAAPRGPWALWQAHQKLRQAQERSAP